LIFDLANPESVLTLKELEADFAIAPGAGG